MIDIKNTKYTVGYFLLRLYVADGQQKPPNRMVTGAVKYYWKTQSSCVKNTHRQVILFDRRVHMIIRRRAINFGTIIL